MTSPTTKEKDDHYYTCCLTPEADGCSDISADPIMDARCRAITKNHCAHSEHIVTEKCQTFASNLINKDMVDMDDPIKAFCHYKGREKHDEHYNACRCVNFDNTLLGQEIIATKSANPGCFYEACKLSNTGKTGTEHVYKLRELNPDRCVNVSCVIKDNVITAEHGDATVNFKQACSASSTTDPTTKTTTSHTPS